MATPSNTLTDMLARYGVNYPDAPGPTPALLAFMRGLGLTYDEAEDIATRGRDRIDRRAEDARSDVERAATRSKENVVADLVRRGVLGSGEANTRLARHAEDRGERLADIEMGRAESLENIDSAFAQTTGGLRTRALETVLDTETREDARKATLAAQEESFKRQEESRAEWFAKTQEAEEKRLQNQIALLGRY